MKVPPLKEEGKWRRFFFGSSGRRRRGGEGEGAGLPEAKRPRVEEAQEQALEEGEEEGEIEEGEEQDEEPAAAALVPPPLPLDQSGGVGAMKEVFEGPHAPGTGLVLQFDQVRRWRVVLCFIPIYQSGPPPKNYCTDHRPSPYISLNSILTNRSAPSACWATMRSGWRRAPAWATSRAPGSLRCWHGTSAG